MASFVYTRATMKHVHSLILIACVSAYSVVFFSSSYKCRLLLTTVFIIIINKLKFNFISTILVIHTRQQLGERLLNIYKSFLIQTAICRPGSLVQLFISLLFSS